MIPAYRIDPDLRPRAVDQLGYTQLGYTDDLDQICSICGYTKGEHQGKPKGEVKPSWRCPRYDDSDPTTGDFLIGFVSTKFQSGTTLFEFDFEADDLDELCRNCGREKGDHWVHTLGCREPGHRYYEKFEFTTAPAPTPLPGSPEAVMTKLNTMISDLAQLRLDMMHYTGEQQEEK